MKNKIFLLALCAAVALAVAGCKTAPNGGRPMAWNVSITKNTPASIEVDLIGIANKNEENFFNGVSTADYWNNPQIRNDQTKLHNLLTKFLPKDQPWIIKLDDPQWQTWTSRGVNKLYVIARLPEATGDWKIPLPIGKKVWDAKGKTIEIVVVDSGISVQTRQKN